MILCCNPNIIKIAFEQKLELDLKNNAENLQKSSLAS